MHRASYAVQPACGHGAVQPACGHGAVQPWHAVTAQSSLGSTDRPQVQRRRVMMEPRPALASQTGCIRRSTAAWRILEEHLRRRCPLDAAARMQRRAPSLGERPPPRLDGGLKVAGGGSSPPPPAGWERPGHAGAHIHPGPGRLGSTAAWRTRGWGWGGHLEGRGSVGTRQTVGRGRGRPRPRAPRAGLHDSDRRPARPFLRPRLGLGDRARSGRPGPARAGPSPARPASVLA